MLVLVRHGQSEANVAKILAGRHDSVLTNRGRDQARTLVDRLGGAQLVYSSPLQRTRDTAALAVPHVTAELDQAFLEQDYGSYDGCALAEVPRSEWQQFRSGHDVALGGGESLADVDARVYERLEQLTNQYGSLVADSEQHLVVVSHVSPIKSAVTWALGIPGSTAWRMRLDNASLTTIGLRDGRPFLASYNEAVAPAVRS